MAILQTKEGKASILMDAQLTKLKETEYNIIRQKPYVISNTRKDIYVFFHICCIGNYQDVVNEIIDQLIKSGLYKKSKKIFYSIVGNPDKYFLKKISKIDKFDLLYLSKDKEEVEYPTLINLQRFSKELIEESYILYIHTKGVSKPYDPFTQNWRKRLLEKTVTEHKVCTSFLDQGFEIAGCGWKEKPKCYSKINYHPGDHEHFSGNFWWATSRFIKSLPDISEIRDNYIQSRKENFLKYRTQCEFWIGMRKYTRVGVNGELNKDYHNKKYYINKSK